MQQPANSHNVNWAAYEWPPWVPDRVRVLIEYIWPSPMDWARNTRSASAPALGAVFHLPLTSPDRIITGHYVHIRDRIGRIVDRDRPGRVYVVELDAGQPKALFE